MISALIDSGEFIPQRYGLSIADCDTWEKLWQFCEMHQVETGEAPTPHLVRLKFPDFQYTPSINPTFAAAQLARESEIRTMKLALRTSLVALEQEDAEQAREALSQIHASRSLGKPGDSIWDEPEDNSGPKYKVPYPSLGRVTGGLGAGELWYLAAPAGAGKTMILCQYVADFLKQGLKIDYLSCEVPTRTINKRVRRSLATKAELKLLDARKANGEPDRESILLAIEMQQGRISGSLHVYDPSHGRVNPGTVRKHMDNADLVVIDHIGLLHTQDGRRAIDDWRALATISNNLMEDKLATGTPLLVAAQLNKQGDEGSDERPPKVTTVGGSYQLVMDGDVVITMKRPSEHTLIHGCEKNREGSSALWYSHYNVAKADFSQITRDVAIEIIANDNAMKY